jgi:hypothetical protein
VQSTGDLFIYIFFLGGVEGEKKMCGIVTGFWYSSRPITGSWDGDGSVLLWGTVVYGWSLLIPGWVLFTGTRYCFGGTVHTGWYCSYNPVLLLDPCFVRGECSSTVF